MKPLVSDSQPLLLNDSPLSSLHSKRPRHAQAEAVSIEGPEDFLAKKTAGSPEGEPAGQITLRVADQK